MERYEIRLSGAGGQGMILAGIILAEAALAEEDVFVTQTQSYGPESRGGASRAEVVLSRDPIDYPKVVKPDILLALTKEAYQKYSRDLKSGGIIIADEMIDISRAAKEIQQQTLLLPVLKTAEEKAGLKLTANIVALGIVSKYIDLIECDHIREAIKKRVPTRTVEINLNAFELGRQLVS